VNVTFFGVRGSTPCASQRISRYGGNTSSVVIDIPRTPPILLDLGTGVRVYGESLPPGPFEGVALVSHLHWDHVQGLPFFAPALRPGSRVALYSPPPGCGLTLAEAFGQGIRPPYFPVHLTELSGRIEFHEVHDGTFAVGAAMVTVKPVPHVGPTAGFRIDWEGVSVAYVPDHQQPSNGSLDIAEEVLELVEGANLLIHDAQYTPEEFRQKRDWGHSTIEYAVEVARQGGVKMLAMFHHDPTHDDTMVDRLAAEARQHKGCSQMELIAAHEGLTVHLAPRS
jgi:phosphoribosyl 1,2-cyclic phosphodiesterase